MMTNMTLDQFESRGFSVGDRFVKRANGDVDVIDIVGVDYLIVKYTQSRNGVLVTESRWVSTAKLADMLYCWGYDAAAVESVDSDWTPDEAAAAVERFAMLWRQSWRELVTSPRVPSLCVGAARRVSHYSDQLCKCVELAAAAA